MLGLQLVKKNLRCNFFLNKFSFFFFPSASPSFDFPHLLVPLPALSFPIHNFFFDLKKIKKFVLNQMCVIPGSIVVLIALVTSVLSIAVGVIRRIALFGCSTREQFLRDDPKEHSTGGGVELTTKRENSSSASDSDSSDRWGNQESKAVREVLKEYNISTYIWTGRGVYSFSICNFFIGVLSFSFFFSSLEARGEGKGRGRRK